MAARKMIDQLQVRCAIYCRVSTPGQLNGPFNSLDNQKEYCEAFIKSQAGKNWQCLPTEYADPGFSGTTLDRPALKRLMVDVDAGLIDTVVVYRFDRISRSTRDFHNLINHLDQKNVSFVSVSEQVNTSEPSGQVMQSIMMSFAQFERDVIAQRTRDKIAGAKRQGRWCGGLVPLGYRMHEEGGRIVIDPDAAKMVQAIFGLYLQKQSLMAVAEELNRRGWLTKRHDTKTGKVWGGKPWTKTYVHNHVTNPVYIGQVRHKGETYAGQHDGIITKKVWKQVQALLSENCRNGGASTKNRHNHLLRGIMYCESCNAIMASTATKKGDRIYRYMVCSSAMRNGWHTCPNPSVSAPTIEAFVKENIAVIGNNPDIQQETVKQVRKLMKAERPALAAECRRLQSQIKKNRTEIDQLVKVLATGPSESVRARLSIVEDQVAAAVQRLAEVDQERASVRTGAMDTEALAKALSQFTLVWDLLFPMEQERLVQLLVERIDYRGKNADLAIEYRLPEIMGLANEISENQEAIA
jgi:site-specific DNA recombinase